MFMFMYVLHVSRRLVCQLIESPRPLLAILRGSFEGIALALLALVRGRPGRSR